MEEPIRILERMEKKLWNISIPYVKVLWKHHKIVEETWELEEEMGRSTQLYFHQVNNFENEIFKGG